MTKKTSLAKQNRSLNSGGVMPDQIKIITTLVKLCHQLKNRSTKYDNQEKLFIVFLYLWLTHQLDDIGVKPDGEAQVDSDFIPDCIKVTAEAVCKAHTFRNVKYGNRSWTEYALLYHTKNDDQLYRWQPIPPSLHHIFNPFLSKMSYGTPWLTSKEKNNLFGLIKTTWSKPDRVKGFPSAVKQSFFKYFTHCVLIDNYLRNITKNVLLPMDKLHHKSSSAYQELDSGQIRAQIFQAQERFLSRLVKQANTLGLGELLIFFRSIKNNNAPRSQRHKSKVHLLDVIDTNNIPDALKSQSIRHEYHHTSYVDVREIGINEEITVGSKRMIEEHVVADGFKRLEEEILTAKPTQRVTLATHIDYYNLCTNHLALLFILLSGTRPHHAISIEKRRSFNNQQVCIKDKGRLRPLFLGDYFKQQVEHYLVLQQALISRLPKAVHSELLWYLLDHNGNPTALSAKSLRMFMHARIPNKVPYMLRHRFCQCALTCITPVKLTNHQIDRLMGHSSYGEHLGSDHLFPASTKQMSAFLNTLHVRFNLQEIKYV